ncbi:bacteriochlorophyll 4-vinyl reductase [Rhodobacter sp. KR11]|jgi:divinyl protochlorophyllide a 8-vinyl-reductase|uniref:bacteriochlorophyll 4-vinyl reductase n=1 Tax=Rhodobacter sp. KR11 TaxID=2974588 RepID=UPI002223C57F|nr:bacteriochlorophyll 4-vinyl reductase [Rhodobacter sp. KR11]MCW1920199.1 bacteriochlorophyll 4-vinyl reductase [Rhodobacter sp. KR11]
MSALIGPNAVLQLIPLLQPGVLARLGISAPPDHGLMPEEPARALHAGLRATDPQAAALLAEAGRRTADYILAHRIPPPAKLALRLMPRALAIRALSRAVARHAWTFAGSGAFAVEAPGRFRLTDNPLIRGETASHPLCHWHVAVFQGLFQALVSKDLHFAETHCAACGHAACRFQLCGP